MDLEKKYIKYKLEYINLKGGNYDEKIKKIIDNETITLDDIDSFTLYIKKIGKPEKNNYINSFTTKILNHKTKFNIDDDYIYIFFRYFKYILTEKKEQKEQEQKDLIQKIIKYFTNEQIIDKDDLELTILLKLNQFNIVHHYLNKYDNYYEKIFKFLNYPLYLNNDEVKKLLLDIAVKSSDYKLRLRIYLNLKKYDLIYTKENLYSNINFQNEIYSNIIYELELNNINARKCLFNIMKITQDKKLKNKIRSLLYSSKNILFNNDLNIQNFPFDKCPYSHPYLNKINISDEKKQIVSCCKEKKYDCINYKYIIKSDEKIKVSEIGKKYYLVHNYYKTLPIKPFKILKPKGDTKYKALESFIRLNTSENGLIKHIKALNNYKNFIESLEYDSIDIGAQSNLGIYFYLIPKTKVKEHLLLPPTIVDKEITNFMYVFDFDKVVNYIINSKDFNNLNVIPKIYWTPDNAYGHISYESILGFNQDYLSYELNNAMNPELYHEIISLVSIDTTDQNSGFIGFYKGHISPPYF